MNSTTEKLQNFKMSEETKRESDRSKKEKQTVKEPKLLRCGRRFYYVGTSSNDRDSRGSN